MSLFKRRETPIQNIAYMGLMAAINVVFVVITTYVAPALFFAIVFVLPLSSAVVTLFCQKKYFPIYALVTTLICTLITIWQPGNTLFYVIPSLITGFVFGVCIEKNVSPLWSIALTTGLQIGFAYLSIPIIQWLFETNTINTFLTAFSLNNFPYSEYLIFPVIFLISLLQEVFSYMILKEEVDKFKKQNVKEKDYPLIVFSINIMLLVALVVFYFVKPTISFAILFILLYFSSYLLIDLIYCKRKLIYILLGCSLFVSCIAFVAIYSLIKTPLQLLLFSIPMLFINFVEIVNYYLLKRKVKATI